MNTAENEVKSQRSIVHDNCCSDYDQEIAIKLYTDLQRRALLAGHYVSGENYFNFRQPPARLLFATDLIRFLKAVSFKGWLS